MKVLNVRNCHEGLPFALEFLEKEGIERDSRNGPVLVSPTPVTTVYKYPNEKVIFWRDRNANPFFHLYESLWFLAGRKDVYPLTRYVKTSSKYSDDGITLHGSYGFRWRQHFKFDQLEHIAKMLKERPDERRGILQMWDASIDGRGTGLDYPCNTIATFQRGFEGELNLVVFCRSNDVIWGTFGANAVQFGMLLEYMALWIGCPVGTYSQVSVNFHVYHNEVWEQVKKIRPSEIGCLNQYVTGMVQLTRLEGDIENTDMAITGLLHVADSGFTDEILYRNLNFYPWMQVFYNVLKAHHIYTTTKDETKYGKALEVLSYADPRADWVVAAREWILRREAKHGN